MNKLKELNITDGQIINLIGFSGDVTVVISDWQEIKYKLGFRNVIGVETYSPEQVDLCHVKIKENSEKLKRACLIVDENFEGLCEFSFISAWNDEPILTIYGEFVELNLA